MSNVNEKQIETIRNLVDDMDKKVDQLLEIGEDFPSAAKNAKQLKAIINIMKIQLPQLPLIRLCQDFTSAIMTEKIPPVPG